MKELTCLGCNQSWHEVYVLSDPANFIFNDEEELIRCPLCLNYEEIEIDELFDRLLLFSCHEIGI